MDGFLLLVWVLLWVGGFADAVFADATRVRLLPKAVWVILILVFSGFGSIAWFIFGRPRGGDAGVRPSNLGARFGHPSARRTDTSAGTGWTLGGAGGRRQSGPMAPDDDPDFLRQLGNRRPDQPGEPDQPA